MIARAALHHHLVRAAVATMAFVAAAVASDGLPTAGAPFALPSVVFEGFGLDGFEGTGSAATALRQIGADEQPDEALLEFKGIAVHGPSGRDAALVPMAAEVQSRIDWIDVAAGVTADPGRLGEGPNQWTGRIGVSNGRESGSESLELRTMLVPSDTSRMVGVAVGPKIERRLRRGLTFFIDGQAEAHAVRSADAGWLSAPPGATDGSLTTLGVAARTGILR